MAMIEMQQKVEKVENENTYATARKLLILALFIPYIFTTYTIPALVSYFVAEVGRDAYSIVEMGKQGLTCLVLASCLWGGGVRFFVGHFKHLLILDVVIAVAIAVAGQQHPMFRFFGDIIQGCMINTGLGQTMNLYVGKLMDGLTDEDRARFMNGARFSGSFGCLIGSVAAVIYNPFNIDQLLWINVAITIGCVIFQHSLVRYFKRVVK